MKDFRDRVDGILKKCTNVFGEDVSYFPSSGGVVTVRGIFDNQYELVDPETEQVISSQQPVLGVNLNSLNFEMKTEDQIQIRNLRYKVTEVQEDGQGGATLFLHKIKHDKKIVKKKGASSP